MIQKIYRAKKARELYRKKLAARSVIQRAVKKYIKKRNWEKEVESHANEFIEVVISIQKVFRWRKRWGMILDWVWYRKACVIRIQKAYRRRRLHLFFM